MFNYISFFSILNINMLRLPEVLIFYMCEYITFREVILLGMTCTKFRELFELPVKKKTNPYLQKMMNNKTFTPQNLSQIFKYDYTFGGLNLTKMINTPYINISKLKYANLSSNKLTHNMMNDLRFIKSLTHLDLSNSKINYEDFEDIHLLTSLTVLDLSNSYIHDSYTVDNLVDLPIEELILSGIIINEYNIDDEFLEFTKTMKNLKILDISHNRLDISPTFFNNIKLIELNLSDTGFEDLSLLPKTLKKLTVNEANETILELKLETLIITNYVGEDLLSKLKQRIPNVIYE